MKISVYTSCAVNYYAKARVLLDSIRKNSPNTTLTLVLCDRAPLDLDPKAHGFDDVWTPEDLGYDIGWIFKHNVMELCTAVKGKALERLMEERPDSDLYVYLDPDVYVYDCIANVLTEMSDASIGLVPHILWPEETEIGVRMTEMSVTEHGIYNLGHLFVRGDKIGRALAAWWRARLDEYCYDDREFGLFTDQRWMDLVPAIFDNVRILREPVFDVASWNLFGRSITQAKEANGQSIFSVNGKRLVTYHFSGTGPTGTHSRVRQIFAPCSGAAAEIERDYEIAIAKHGQKLLERLPPAFDFFDDGALIVAEVRKIYRRHKDLQQAFPNPYSGEFQSWLRENRPYLVSGLAIGERRAERAFNELFDPSWYLKTYPDVAEEIEHGIWQDALDHYIRVGSSLLYDPNPLFISSYYFERAKYHDGHLLDGKSRYQRNTLLWHYLTVGLSNGIEPVEHFDSSWYLHTYDDLRKAFLSCAVSVPLAHFLNYGDRERRKAGPLFDPELFLQITPRALALLEQGVVGGPFAAFVKLGLAGGR